MRTSNEIILALTTVASLEEAQTIAKRALEDKASACVHIEGPLTSHYRWKDETVMDQEYRLLFKTTPSALDKLRATVLSHHPYETPFWASWAASSSSAYRAWIADNLD